MVHSLADLEIIEGRHFHIHEHPHAGHTGPLVDELIPLGIGFDRAYHLWVEVGGDHVDLTLFQLEEGNGRLDLHGEFLGVEVRSVPVPVVRVPDEDEFLIGNPLLDHVRAVSDGHLLSPGVAGSLYFFPGHREVAGAHQ